MNNCTHSVTLDLENHAWCRRCGAMRFKLESTWIQPGDLTGAITEPIHMHLFCPHCHKQHIDVDEPASSLAAQPHKTHACQYCGQLWQPALVRTKGVQFLPGCKNEPSENTKRLLGRCVTCGRQCDEGKTACFGCAPR